MPFSEQISQLLLLHSLTPFILAALAALLIGLGKTGIPALSLTFTAIMALAIPGKASIGMVLLLLIIGDTFAVLYYRKHAQIKILLKLLPAIVFGLLIGTLLLDLIPDETVRPILALIIFCMIGIEFARSRKWLTLDTENPNLAIAFGVAAGIVTVVGNAAGPIMAMYFLLLRFDKYQFMGTSAWLFFIVNTSKVPLLISIDVITLSTFYTLLALAPFTVVGAITGKRILHYIPNEIFARLVLFSAILSSGYFLIDYLVKP